MYHSHPVTLTELAPPPKRRTPPSEQTDEPPGLIESERVDVEREAPLGENESIERHPGERPDSEPPAFEE
jgi:hypothetical protein